MLGKSKGQAAMEYLMTYGWALLVIVIVVVVLFGLNIFKSPPVCLFDEPGFLCQGTLLLRASDQTLFSDIGNGNYRSIKIVGIAFIQGRDSPPGDYNNWPSAFKLANGLTVKQQGSFNLGKYTQDGTSTSSSTTCHKADGSACPVLTNGQDFSGRLYVAYRYTDDDPAIVPVKIVGANVATRAQ